METGAHRTAQWATHWEDVHRRCRAAEALPWHQPVPLPSLRALEAAAVRHGAPLVDLPLVDVGGGASTLAGALVARGWTDVTVVDISPAALALARKAMGVAADAVSWVVADAAAWVPPRRHAVWHDRAVFHFLTEEPARRGYLAALRAATVPGGVAVIGTFAPGGPDRCSGLPVHRYDAAALAATLGPSFGLMTHWIEDHVTPGGAVQPFSWCVFVRR